MAVRSGVGFAVKPTGGHAWLFAESPSRVVACVTPARKAAVVGAAQAAGVAVTEIGTAGGDRIVVDGLVDLALDEVTAAWRGRIPDALGAGTSH
jgi:phosphoribosylformylglycinamidine synthase